jgi:uncharacterized repeat protein (TIGR02543 family)
MLKKQFTVVAFLMSIFVTMNVPVYVSADNTPIPLVYKSYFNSSTDINQLTVRGNATLGRTPYLPFIQNFGGSLGLVVLQGTKDFSFNSAFINEKVDISRVPDKGISSFIEFDVYRGSSLHTGDWFSFVLSKDTNILTQRNAASINNSLSILLSFYREMPNATRETDNYTNLEASIFRNLNGSQNLLTNYVVIDPTYKTELSTKAPSQLVRKYKFWFDYNATSKIFEIRLRFDNSYVRPQTPVASFTNIDASFLGDTFFAGITGSTGGLDYGLIARQWLFANRSLPNGIDPTLDPSLLIDDTTPPTIPTLTPTQTETGWVLNPESTDDSMSTIIYEYQLDNGAITTQPSNFEIPDGTRQVKIWARDIFNKASEPKTINFYKVTYSGEGSTQPDVTLWYPEKTPALFPSFSKTGHTHLGFTSTQNNQNEDALSTYTVTQDATLYAKYSTNAYSISYVSNSGETINPSSFAYNEELEGIPQPERLGYLFEGWYKDAEFEIVFEDLFMPAEDFTLYAKWSIITYNLSLTLNGGTVTTLPPSTYTVETNSIVLPTPSQKGYVFLGWYTNPTLTSSVVTSLNQGSVGHQTFYASWTLNQAEIDAVIALIAAIDTPITLASNSAIQAALAAYNNLLPIQQEGVTNQGLLFGYQEAYALLLEEIDTVIDLISPLDKVITLNDQAAIEAARAAYDLLTAEQKGEVTNLQVLLDAEAALLSLEAIQAVIETLEDLPDFEDITLEDKDDIEAARQAFNALTPAQQANISNELKQKLLDAEAALLSLEAIQAVIETLEDLPDFEDITLEDKDDIEAARQAFNALTPAQQANISNELRQKLIDAEAALAALEQTQNQFNLLPIHLFSGLIIAILYFLKTKKEGK